HLLNAERDLLPEPALSPGRGLLAVGDPDFEGAREPGSAPIALAAATPTPPALGLRARQWPCAGAQPIALAPLPAARAEAEDIARLWPAGAGSTRSLLGSDAGERDVKREALGHAVIHIATHGVLVEDTCGAAAQGTRGVGGVDPL